MAKHIPRYKLTAVTVYHKGHNHTLFIHLPVDSDGKVRVSNAVFERFLKQIGVQSGNTICIGGL